MHAIYERERTVESRKFTTFSRDVIHGNAELCPEGGAMERNKDTFPKNGRGKYDGWHRLIREHLVSKNACRECLEVFEACWEEYVACEKSKSNKNS